VKPVGLRRLPNFKQRFLYSENKKARQQTLMNTNCCNASTAPVGLLHGETRIFNRSYSTVQNMHIYSAYGTTGRKKC